MSDQTHATGGAGPPVDSGKTRRRNGWRRDRSGDTGNLPAVSAGSLPASLADERVTTPGAGLRQGTNGRATTPGAANGRTSNVPIEPDWMSHTQAEADRARNTEKAMATWTPGAGLPEVDVTGVGGSLVRPYARTGGRTKPVRDLSLEALVQTSLSGRESSASPWLSPEHSSIIAICNGTASVAEIAAKLSVPLGVARVIIADMVDLGLVEVMKTSASDGDERDPDFLRRVLSGLQRL